MNYENLYDEMKKQMAARIMNKATVAVHPYYAEANKRLDQTNNL